MSLVRVYSPTSEAELLFLQSLLEADEVPVYIDHGGFGGVLPGISVDYSSRKWIQVPESAVDTARELIEAALKPG